MKTQLITTAIASHFSGPWEIIHSEVTHFSEIYFLRGGGFELVAKMVVPHLFEQTPVNDRLELAQRLHSNTLAFRGLLQHNHVPLSREFAAITMPDGQALHVTTHEGPNCDTLLRADISPDNARRLIRGILESVARVLHQPNPPMVGLDLQLANFTLNGSIRYVDVFPPLFYSISEGRYVVHEPQPNNEAEITSHVQRKFTTTGTLRRFRFFTLRVSAALERIWLDEVKRVLDPQVWQEVCSFLDALPDRKLPVTPNRADVYQALDAITPDDFDSMRDLALKVVPDGPHRNLVLEEVFLAARYPGPGEHREKDPKAAIGKLLEPFVA